LASWRRLPIEVLFERDDGRSGMDSCSRCDDYQDDLGCGCLLLVLCPPLGVLYFVLWALGEALGE